MCYMTTSVAYLNTISPGCFKMNVGIRSLKDGTSHLCNIILKNKFQDNSDTSCWKRVSNWTWKFLIIWRDTSCSWRLERTSPLVWPCFTRPCFLSECQTDQQFFKSTKAINHRGCRKTVPMTICTIQKTD